MLCHRTSPQACSAGGDFSLCVLRNGRVSAFGRALGHLGLGDLGLPGVSTPTLVPLLVGVVSCSAGDMFSLCVFTNGSVASMGYGSEGSLGIGPRPIMIYYPTLVLTKVKMIDKLLTHCCSHDYYTFKYHLR
jgi:alpha-tubulin suppressor-like RCC1 family protein